MGGIPVDEDGTVIDAASKSGQGSSSDWAVGPVGPTAHPYLETLAQLAQLDATCGNIVAQLGTIFTIGPVGPSVRNRPDCWPDWSDWDPAAGRLDARRVHQQTNVRRGERRD